MCSCEDIFKNEVQILINPVAIDCEDARSKKNLCGIDGKYYAEK